MSKNNQKKGCCLFALMKWFVIALAVLAVLTLLFGGSSNRPTSGSQTSTTVSHTEPPSYTAAPTAAPTPTPTPAPTPSPTAEPSSLQGWAEHVAQSVYGRFDNEYADLISVSCEQVDGESAPMIDIYVKYPGTFARNNDERMSAFLYQVMNVNWKFADLAKAGKIEYGSVFVHGRTMFADKYGNETEGDAAQIRIKASEAAKVNWGYDTVVGDMMPGISSTFGIHPIIREGLSSSYYNKIRK